MFVCTIEGLNTPPCGTPTMQPVDIRDNKRDVSCNENTAFSLHLNNQDCRKDWDLQLQVPPPFCVGGYRMVIALDQSFRLLSDACVPREASVRFPRNLPCLSLVLRCFAVYGFEPLAMPISLSLSRSQF